LGCCLRDLSVDFYAAAGADHSAAGKCIVGWLATARVAGTAAWQLILYVAHSPARPREAGMATKITVALEDDLDGGPAAETVRFELGGTQYEIDLNKKNAKAFRKQLAPFVEHARRAGPGREQRRPRTSSSRRRSGDIQAWANEQGIAVSGRGRIPASVAEQYEAAVSGS
jgi:hypothetical protein